MKQLTRGECHEILNTWHNAQNRLNESRPNSVDRESLFEQNRKYKNEIIRIMMIGSKHDE